MKLIIKIFAMFLLYITVAADAFGQYKLSHQVIGSTGNFSKDAAGNSISSTTGEAAIVTLRDGNGNLFLTQGFQQPSSSALQIAVESFKTTCSISNDGYAVATVTGGKEPYTYSWTPVGGTDDTAKFLSPGIYTVKVTAANGFYKVDTITVVANEEVDCKLVIYTGISPNGDGINDTWIIDGISLFPENSVTIFNRWGDVVWSAANYDNLDRVWSGTNRSGVNLSDGTYYYIIETSVEKYKGWVEITK